MSKHKMALISGFLFLISGLFPARSAFAAYLLTYRLYDTAHAQQAKYGVVVVLGDHIAKHFGNSDDLLSQYVVGQYESPDSRFLRGYPQLVYRWYENRIRQEPAIYGDDSHGIEILLKELREKEPSFDSLSSFVVLTDPNDFFKPIALSRVSVEDPRDRLTPILRHFYSSRSELPDFPVVQQGYSIREIPDFQADPNQKDLVPLPINFPTRTETWFDGALAEVKSFSIEPGKLDEHYPFLFYVLRSHRLFHYSATPFPKESIRFDDGRLFPKDADRYRAKRVSLLVTAYYGDKLTPLCQQAGLVPWKVIQDDRTRGRKLTIATASPEVYDSSIVAAIQSGMPDLTKSRYFLKFDPTVADELSLADCAQKLLL